MLKAVKQENGGTQGEGRSGHHFRLENCEVRLEWEEKAAAQ